MIFRNTAPVADSWSEERSEAVEVVVAVVHLEVVLVDLVEQVAELVVELELAEVELELAEVEPVVEGVVVPARVATDQAKKLVWKREPPEAHKLSAPCPRLQLNDSSRRLLIKKRMIPFLSHSSFLLADSSGLFTRQPESLSNPRRYL
jgi:hypothetical protein